MQTLPQSSQKEYIPSKKRILEQNHVHALDLRVSMLRGFMVDLLTVAASRNQDVARFLREANIDLANLNPYFSLEHCIETYNQIALLHNDEGLMMFSRPLPSGTLEFLCRSLINASTLGEALELAGRYLRITLPDFHMVCEPKGEYTQIRFVEQSPKRSHRNDPVKILSVRLILRIVHGIASWLIRQRLLFDAIDFPFTRPDYIDHYINVYHASKLGFDAEQLTLLLHANFLNLHIHRDKTSLSQFLEGFPGKIIFYRRDYNIAACVRDLLRENPAKNLSLEDIASNLCMSSRTLARRLDDEKISFRDIKNNMRKELAYDYLVKTRKSVAQIAVELGYGNVSTFYRAFIAWSGLSPRQFRQQMLYNTPDIPHFL